mmetsp:Transcript_4371/g.6507  ORF Transcript_4371/g.6507 Transcript_4371/m.6507 type:complete len:243 (-) Transcript_4371:120-848(-)
MGAPSVRVGSTQHRGPGAARHAKLARTAPKTEPRRLPMLPTSVRLGTTRTWMRLAARSVLRASPAPPVEPRQATLRAPATTVLRDLSRLRVRLAALHALLEAIQQRARQIVAWTAPRASTALGGPPKNNLSSTPALSAGGAKETIRDPTPFLTRRQGQTLRSFVPLDITARKENRLRACVLGRGTAQRAGTESMVRSLSRSLWELVGLAPPLQILSMACCVPRDTTAMATRRMHCRAELRAT